MPGRARTRIRPGALRALGRALTEIEADTPSALEWLAPRLAVALGSDMAIGYSARVEEDRLRIERVSTTGLVGLLEVFNGFLARLPPIGWTLYNPIRPAPCDRNRLRDAAELLAKTDEKPPVWEIYRRFGFEHLRQVRVVLTEGASMVGYVSVFQASPFADDQSRALRALIAPMRRRLALDRRLADAPRSRAALEAALDAIGSPAWIVRRDGLVRHANAAAIRLGDGDRRGRREWLREVLRAPVDGVQVTPIRGAGEPDDCLVVARTDAVVRDASARLAATAARWGLTARLTRVLELLSRGASNRAIAAELAISESTVEQHVAAIFDRAGVGSRAAVVAELLWG